MDLDLDELVDMYTKGLGIRRHREAMEADKETRAFQRELHAFKVKELKLLEKAREFEGKAGAFEFLQKTPEATKEFAGPPQEGVPGVDREAEPGVDEPITMPHAPIDFSGLAELGIPEGTKLTPSTAGAAKMGLQKKLMELQAEREAGQIDPRQAEVLARNLGVPELAGPGMPPLDMNTLELLQRMQASKGQQVPVAPGLREAIGPGMLPEGEAVGEDELRAAIQMAGQREATKRTGMQQAATAALGSDVTDEDLEAMADRVSSGQMSLESARGMLGGVKSPKLIPLMRKLEGKVVLPTAARVSLAELKKTQVLVDLIEEQANKVMTAKTATERAEETLLLTQTAEQIKANMSRGFGEKGALSEGDVKRATALVPGWKAANFAPGYVKKEVEMLRSILGRTENTMMDFYTKPLTKPGAASGAGGVGAARAKPKTASDYLSKYE